MRSSTAPSENTSAVSCCRRTAPPRRGPSRQRPHARRSRRRTLCAPTTGSRSRCSAACSATRTCARSAASTRRVGCAVRGRCLTTPTWRCRSPTAGWPATSGPPRPPRSVSGSPGHRKTPCWRAGHSMLYWLQWAVSAGRLQWAVSAGRLQWTVSARRLQWTVSAGRLQWARVVPDSDFHAQTDSFDNPGDSTLTQLNSLLFLIDSPPTQLKSQMF